VPAPAVTVAVVGAILTVIGAAGFVSVSLAEPVRDGSPAATAVIVSDVADGIVAGETYWPEAEIVPTVSLPPAMPLTCQSNPEFAAPVVCALKLTGQPPTGTLAVCGDTVSETVGGSTEAADLDELAHAASSAIASPATK
jgi:hypothetical protein